MKQTVERIIDRIITNSFRDGKSPVEVISELEKRSENIFKIIEKQDMDISSLFNVLIGESDIDDESIPKRVRYAYFYVKYCNKRIADMKWVIKKRTDLFIKSRKYTDRNIFDMVSLKEKLS